MSKKTEFLPAVGTIAGAPGEKLYSAFLSLHRDQNIVSHYIPVLGSDKMLVELAKRALLKAQKPTKVNTGATMFEAKI